MKSWRCIVCGYIHHGDQPPAECPICGAPASDFEPVAPAPAAAAPVSPVRRWVCLVCGYVHEGDAPPAVCPLCGATADSFEPEAEQAPAAPATAGRVSRIIIIGGGMAGVSAAEAARRAAPDAEIVLLSREPHEPYYRLNLTRFLAGEVGEDALPLHPAAWYAEHGIELRLGTEVAALHPAEQRVDLADGSSQTFDRLVLTTGAHAFLPPLPGANLKGVFSLRSLDDARALVRAVKSGARCVCIGGGLLGLETAGALVARGASVSLLESHAALMPRQLNAHAGEILGRYVGGLGIRLLTRAQTRELAGGDRVRQVALEDGSRLDTDFVVIATGVRSNTHLARAAGLDVHQGVLVNNALQTSHPSIYAAGDACEHMGVLYGSWQAAQAQGTIAGLHAAGGTAEFGGLPRSHTLKVLGLCMTSIGQFEPADGSYRVLESEHDGQYQRLVFHDGRLAGAVLLGDTHLASAAHKAIEQGRDFSDWLADHPTVERLAEHLR